MALGKGKIVRQMAAKDPPVCNYFVDEAGDGTLFDDRGRVIVGTEGCSQFFVACYRQKNR